MKQFIFSLILISSSVHAAKLTDFTGKWYVSGDCQIYNSASSQVQYSQPVITGIQDQLGSYIEISEGAEKSEIKIDGLYSEFREISTIQNINKGKQVKTTKQCGDNPLGLKQCVIIKDIKHATLSGSTLTYVDVMKESWVRPFYTINGPTFKLELDNSKKKLTLSRNEKTFLPKWKFSVTCELARK